MVLVYHDSLGQIYAVGGLFGHLGHLAGNGVNNETDCQNGNPLTTHRLLFTCEEMAAKHILELLKKPTDYTPRFGVQPIYYVCANSSEGAWIIKRWEGLMPQETIAAVFDRGAAEALARSIEVDLGTQTNPIEFIDECAGQQSKSWEPELEALVRK